MVSAVRQRVARDLYRAYLVGKQSQRLVHFVDCVQADVLRNERGVVHVQKLVQAQLVLHFKVRYCVAQPGVLTQHDLAGLNDVLVRDVLRQVLRRHLYQFVLESSVDIGDCFDADAVLLTRCRRLT